MIPRPAVALVALLCLALSIGAQPLSGAYTIDNTLPTGGTNYASFVDAAQALMSLGVNGPVEFTVLVGNGSYGGFHLGPFPGASAANPVTFRGVGFPVIQGTYPLNTQVGPRNHTIHLYASSYSGLGTYLLGTGPLYLTLEGLEVTNGIGNGSGAIVALGCTGLTLRNCRLHDSDSAFGIAFSPDAHVEDCEIYGISPLFQGSWAGHYAAMGVLASDNAIVRGNRVHDCVHAGLYVGGQINLSTGIPITTSSNMLVANNMMWNVTGRAAWAANPWGVLLVYCAPGAVVAHNSIRVPPWPGGSGAGSGIVLASTAAPAMVSDNIVQHEGDGACIAYASAHVPAAPLVMDHNLYDLGPSAFVGLKAGAIYTTLAAWQGITGQEAASLVAPAGFVSATDLHITLGSAANVVRGSAVAQVPADFDGNARDPVMPCRGADEFVLTLDVSQPQGPGTGVFISNYSQIPGHDYFNVLSLELCPGGPGAGPYLGLCASTPMMLQILIDQVLLPQGAEPFHFIAPSTTTTFGPYPVDPVTAEGVCFEYTGGVVGAVSEVESIVIH